MDLHALVESQPQAISAVLVLSGVMMLLSAANAAVSLWDKTRRKPPIDQELQYYAKKSDVAAVEQRLLDAIRANTERHERVMEKHAEEQRTTVDGIFSRMNGIKDAVEVALREYAREIGHLDGRTEKKKG